MRPFACTGLIVAGTALLAAGCAASEGRTSAAIGRQCFNASTISGFVEATRDHVIVNTGPRDYYRLDTFAPCEDLDFRETIAIKATSGSPWVCSGMDAELIVPSTIGPHTCMLRNMRKLSPVEVQALNHPRRK